MLYFFREKTGREQSFMPIYTPGESLSLLQRGRNNHTLKQIIVLAVSGNDVILELRFDDGTSSLKKYDWRSPLSEQSGRSIAYENLSVWELRDIVQAGIAWPTDCATRL
jgi:hypothetical protein